MPEIVNLPSHARAILAGARKRPGRDHASVMASMAAEATTAGASTGLRDLPHMAYNPDNRHRTEDARHLNPRARRIVGVERFGDAT